MTWAVWKAESLVYHSVALTARTTAGRKDARTAAKRGETTAAWRADSTGVPWAELTGESLVA